MAQQFQNRSSDSSGVSRPSVEFIVICVAAFIAGLSTTIYLGGSMAYEMEMPGGWKMSMMWMRMPGQTWVLSGLGFLLMWLAMMIAMMMPSALPAFLKTRRNWRSLCYMASGYFTIWLIAGFGTYILGAWFNNASMHSPFLSRAVPLLSGAILVAAGTIQLTRWKLKHLLRCRSTFGCGISCPQNKSSFLLGCRQGMACCGCCATLMTTQLVLGIMNPLVMMVVAIAITGEKLLPKPEVIARLAGVIIIIAGIATGIRWATLSYA